MWHEARRQEKKIRGLMVDYQRRAERRRNHYEQIKLDPNQFIRVHGLPLKVHLEPSVALAAEGPQSMQPWQGDPEIMIDRFDVRSHLDFIPDKIDTNEKLSGEEAKIQRKSKYEAYRILVQNEVAGVSEEQHLKQLYLDEQFGCVDEKQKGEEEKKKILAEKKAAIGFSYDGDSPATPFQPDQFKKPKEDSDESDFDECDLDNVLDIKKLTSDQTKLLNEASHTYGMQGHDYSHFMKVDKEEAEAIRMAKIFEEEKAQFSGRKSRRERRAFKEKRLAGRPISPPSYATRESPKFEPLRKSSSSRSPSPVSSAAVSMQFITSFGGSDEEGGAVHGPDLPAHLRLQPSKGSVSNSSLSRFRRSASPKLINQKRTRSRYSFSRSRSRSRSPQRYGRSRSRSRTRDYRHRRSLSRNRRYSRSRSRSRSRPRYRRSRSRGWRSRSSSSSSLSESPDRPPSPPIKQYRRASLSSSSDSSSDSEKEQPCRKIDARAAPSERHKKSEPLKSLSGSKHGSSSSKGHSHSTRLTPQERLKIRMQRAISKQQKADVKARARKVGREEQQRMDREDELRAMAIDLRRREREKRHKERVDEEENETWMGGSRRSRSPSSSSSSCSSPEVHRRVRSRSRSRSPSPRRRSLGSSSQAARLVDY